MGQWQNTNDTSLSLTFTEEESKTGAVEVILINTEKDFELQGYWSLNSNKLYLDLEFPIFINDIDEYGVDRLNSYLILRLSKTELKIKNTSDDSVSEWRKL